MFLDTKEEHEAQFSLLLLHQHHALSITSFGNPCPHRSVLQLLCQILGQLILTAQPLLHANMSKCEFFLPLVCHLYSSLYKKIKVCIAVGFAHFPADTSPSFPLFPDMTSLQCAFHAPCIQVLCLRAEPCSLFVSVLLCEITETDPDSGCCPCQHFMCSLYALCPIPS